ncbi:MAG: hypothetical protein BGO68_04665 [Candidatus Amoebophilus sp. 36-38]|nr:MAG: hypothetical protein BGO68_04665 [Candidatus Amoebophilus sp. 36-38]
MLHKLLKYLGIILIVTTTSQCLSKCKQKPPYDTVNLDLKWETESHPITLSGLNLENASGLTCHVPSKQATYFLNEDGNCWEFTNEGNDLACNPIGSLSTFSLNNSFVFVAGSTEQESLFFGTISGNNIDLYKLESGAWTKVVNAEDLSTFFPGLTIDTNKYIASCTIEQEGEKKGCLMFKLQSVAPAKDELGCLLFSTEDPHFKAINIDPQHKQTEQGIYLTGMVAVRDGNIILGQGYPKHGDACTLISLKDDQITFLNPPGVHNGLPPSRTRPPWEIFPLFLADEFPIVEPIFSIFNDDKRSIYRMDSDYVLQEMTLPPDPENKILNQKSLILPFYNELYWITTITAEDGNKETVSYKGTLVTTTKKPERNP